MLSRLCYIISMKNKKNRLITKLADFFIIGCFTEDLYVVIIHINLFCGWVGLTG